MAREAPDLLGQAVGPIFEPLGLREQRVLLAMLERQAAETYRRLADDAAGEEGRTALLGAAGNEDRIADILEGLEPEAERIAQDLHARFPVLDGLFDSVLLGRPVEEQLQLQRAAELGAAALFRSLAEAEPDAGVRQKLLDCGDIEAANAAVLDAQLA